MSSYFAGFMIDYTGRWDVVFYYLGIITAIWCILFVSFIFVYYPIYVMLQITYFVFFQAILCFERPQTHPYISEKEKQFIQSKIIYLENKECGLQPTPWKAMLTSRPVIVLIFSASFYSWAFNVVNTDLPKYMNDVIHISIRKNAIYSSLPKVLSIFITLFAGFLSDWMLVKRRISLTKIRKIFAALGSFNEIITYFRMCV